MALPTAAAEHLRGCARRCSHRRPSYLPTASQIDSPRLRLHPSDRESPRIHHRGLDLTTCLLRSTRRGFPCGHPYQHLRAARHRLDSNAPNDHSQNGHLPRQHPMVAHLVLSQYASMPRCCSCLACRPKNPRRDLQPQAAAAPPIPRQTCPRHSWLSEQGPARPTRRDRRSPLAPRAAPPLRPLRQPQPWPAAPWPPRSRLPRPQRQRREPRWFRVHP
mmetsp:Transcript_32327/g.59278  ORF Transcript_32327/g.59278 Transcript_32327/m.59278 type:complete len:218 (+) Transcript_32327:1222-1875(+)